MRGEKSRRGRRSTTKKGRTAVWDIGRRRSLLHRWGRLSPATLCWLRRPQPQTRSRKVSYDLVREERGQVRRAKRLLGRTWIFPLRWNLAPFKDDRLLSHRSVLKRGIFFAESHDP